MSGFNPFAALMENDDSKKSRKPSLSSTLENIFGFTINPQHCKSEELLYLEEVHNVHEKSELELDLLQYALFERLFMCNENSDLRNSATNCSSNSNSREIKVIKYLYTCLENLKEYKSHLKPEEETEIRDKIMQNVATAIIQPDIYSGQDIPEEMLLIIINDTFEADTFFIEISKRVLDDDKSKDSLRNLIHSMNSKLVKILVKCSLSNLTPSTYKYLEVMSSNELLAELFIDSCAPKNGNVGVDYAVTPIGAFLNMSVLPKSPGGKFEYFTDSLDQMGQSNTEDLIWVYQEKLNEKLHKFFLSMLKCSAQVRDKTLRWLGGCLKTNAARGKIWNAQMIDLNPAVYACVTDGFAINLCHLLLGLCQPFCGNIADGKILKVDPTYYAVPNDKAEEKNVHMKDMSEETCFLPVDSIDEAEEQRPMADSYNFVTECFFMAHRAVDLGYRVAVDKLVKQNQEMGRIQRAFNDALQQAGGNSDLVGTIKDRMSEELAKYLSLKCALSSPDLIRKLFDLISATTYWLCQVAVHDNFKDTSSYAPLKQLPVNFPLDNKIPNTLKCTPEYIVENVVSFLVFLRRFSPKVFGEQGYDKLSPVLTFVLIYIGSEHRLKNPHVRARLAEGLESLLPFHKEDQQTTSHLGSSQRQRLFTDHPHRLQIVNNLMKVFVGIEMTGQSVEFEQKFNYRRPMYIVFDYVWELPEHMECFRALAKEAEENMEAVNPPLFLKFANLLINDAIFLLDEALAHMAKLREMQQAQSEKRFIESGVPQGSHLGPLLFSIFISEIEDQFGNSKMKLFADDLRGYKEIRQPSDYHRDRGEWADLGPRERTQNISYMQHIGNLAKFDNILGKDTIRTLERLTSKISSVFTHSTMVDRIAAMLNYFLLNLVGPNKKNFKVKDASEYHFRPADTVLEICKIYAHLKDSAAFLCAVSQDGRSYSPELFALAEEVLVRIGGGALIGDLKEVAEKVAEKSRENQANEEASSEAPEHFLDPIMSTLMSDPVILPSSKQTVDRSTIARHLLSDQTDPFNRSPLSMDQVMPNTELAEEIRRWLQERRGGGS
ncbi:unnamed protein product [Phaedon cochleariae]|uniref:Ubiquitin conjugation factor E4 A n=1 Tax=Phaedon cochleariae TaxID=80249 RepID=A0A9N9SGA1_PHACE|nr:unnamed protein product [Phaedon cochleariae]